MEDYGRFPGTRAARALAEAGLIAVWAATATLADVPAGYKGTPYLGTPRAIPGRVDFEHYDMGGPGVAWKHDNKAGAAGSFAGGREGDGEAQHPSFYTTNSNPGEKDNLPDGTPYPSADNPKSIYIGASHASDWVNVTVRVGRSGEYWLSSHFASEGGQIKVHVAFNGVNKTGNLTLTGTNGYHNWRFYRNFAKVALDSGVQVLQFTLDQAHVNWDYVYLANDSAVATGLEVVGSSFPRLQARAAVLRPGSGATRWYFGLPGTGPSQATRYDVRGVPLWGHFAPAREAFRERPEKGRN